MPGRSDREQRRRGVIEPFNELPGQTDAANCRTRSTYKSLKYTLWLTKHRDVINNPSLYAEMLVLKRSHGLVLQWVPCLWPSMLLRWSYASVAGRMQEAKGRLRHAIELDKEARKLALEDEDLKPLWDWIARLE